MTVSEFLDYLFRGRDTGPLALQLAWVYEERKASEARRHERG